MTDERYNGWSNYETWRVNLELCDDQINSLSHDRITFDSVDILADHLREYVDDVLTNFGERSDSIALDYARAFVSDVDWYEIAEHGIDAGIVTAEPDDNDD